VTATVAEPGTIGRPTLSSERARAMGRASGRARRKLRLADVEAQLPPLDTRENIRLAYELVQRWACGGLLAGSVAGSAVRACDGAAKLLEQEATFEAIEALRGDLAELRSERDALLQQVEQLQLAARRTA
jgi:hypothetical protein